MIKLDNEGNMDTVKSLPCPENIIFFKCPNPF